MKHRNEGATAEPGDRAGYLLQLESPTISLVGTAPAVALAAEDVELLLEPGTFRLRGLEKAAELEDEEEDRAEVRPEPVLMVGGFIVHTLYLGVDHRKKRWFLERIQP